MTDLAALVVELDTLDATHEARTFERIRALARADAKAFLDALASLPDGSARGEAIEAIVIDETFDPVFEPLVERYLEAVVAELHAATGPEAAQASMALYPLGDLEPPKITTAFADRLYDRIVVTLRHPHPDVRAAVVELVACWSSPKRVGARDPVLALLERDPDPVVRDAAYRALADFDALPPGARRPWSPTTLRGLRRWMAGGGG